jgi:hypothetical protein
LATDITFPATFAISFDATMKQKEKRKKIKTVYLEDKGETVYSMAALSGMTPEELDEFNRKKKNRIQATGRERWAMIRAAVQVYGTVLLITVGAFALAGILMYLLLK